MFCRDNQKEPELKRLLIIASVASLLTLLASCNGPAVDNGTASRLPGELLPFHNVPFTLKTAVIYGKPVDLGYYRIFHILFTDSIIYGDNGIAHYYGGYSDSPFGFVVDYVYKWSIGGSRDLNPCYLVGRWQMEVEDSTVTLTGNGSKFQFHTSFAAPVSEDPAVDETWRLLWSNDTAFSDLNMNHYMPELTMTSNRLYSLEFPPASDDSLGGHCTEEGAFGTDGKGNIYFYWTGGEFSVVPFLSTNPISFLRRIEASTGYGVSGAVLTLSGDPDGFSYKFILN